MPDLSFSGTNNINIAWTVQKLVNQVSPPANLGYDTKAPEAKPEEEKAETDGK
jgi:hypothetical protein